MSENELLDAIGQRGRQRREEILAAAHEKAASLLKKAEREIGGISDGVLEKARLAVRDECARIVNEARAAVRAAYIVAKHEALNRAMRDLENHLEELHKRPDYSALMGALIEECLSAVNGPVRLRCRPADLPLVKKHVAAAGYAATVETGDVPLGGVMAAWGDDFRLVRRNSFADRVAKARPELLREANAILFEKPTG